MIESKNDASRNLEKALQALEQAKQPTVAEGKLHRTHSKGKGDMAQCHLYPLIFDTIQDLQEHFLW